MTMLKENLIDALAQAIAARRPEDWKRLGHGRDSAMVQGWVQVKEALERDEAVDLQWAADHYARLRGAKTH